MILCGQNPWITAYIPNVLQLICDLKKCHNWRGDHNFLQNADQVSRIIADHNFRENIVHECDVSAGGHKSFTDTQARRNNFHR